MKDVYVLPILFRRIAQLVEQLTLNQRVRGSSPRAPTIALILTLLDQPLGEPQKVLDQGPVLA